MNRYKLENKKNFLLDQIDSEDFGDFIGKVEHSFGIQFKQDDFTNVATYGDFSNLVLSKISGLSEKNCTSHQFYNRFKTGVAELNLTSKPIHPKTELETLIPRKNRLHTLQKLEKELDISLEILTPKEVLKYGLFTGYVMVFIAFFFYHWKIVTLVFGILMVVTHLIFKFGIEFKVKTIGELVTKTVTEHYKKSRRNSNSYNKKEVEVLLQHWFEEEFE